MSRVLFAWELGANWGHLARDLPVAQRLRDAGYDVVFAARDTRVAAELLSPAGFAFVQSPVAVGRTRLARPPANYAELLAAEGWCDRPALLGHLHAWSTLISFGAIDAVVADHAPGALIAARIAGRVGIAFGSGFEIPPDVEPMPSIRPWEQYLPERLMSSERRVLADINAAMSALGGEPFARLGQIFGADPVLATFGELDHYGDRRNGRYVGSIHGLNGVPEVRWPAGDRRRVLVYLRPRHHATALVIAELAAAGVCAVCVVPGAPEEFKARHRSTSIWIVDHPVSFGPLLDGAAAMISYASSGVMSEALQMGVPLLMIPTTVEQYLGARQAVALGVGLVIDGEPDAERIRAGLSSLLSKSRYKENARAFAARHAGSGPQYATEAVAMHVEESISRRVVS
ncbi:MAG: nucleotide disphospho-sugar-binding domain-containing protein [Pseudomonadota bacterium]